MYNTFILHSIILHVHSTYTHYFNTSHIESLQHKAYLVFERVYARSGLEQSAGWALQSHTTETNLWRKPDVGGVGGVSGVGVGVGVGPVERNLSPFTAPFLCNLTSKGCLAASVGSWSCNPHEPQLAGV